MAITAAQWKRAVLPALDGHTGWAFRQKFAYRTPVGWVAMGVLGVGSGFRPDTLYVWSVSMPLFIPTEHLTLSHGQRVPNGSSTHRLDQLEPAAELAVRELPVDEASALRRIASAGRREDAAYALILEGRYGQARQALEKSAPTADPPEWVFAQRDRMAHMVRLLEGPGPEAAVEQLAAWRSHTMTAIGLTQ
jgi:hypothetical protein